MCNNVTLNHLKNALYEATLQFFFVPLKRSIIIAFLSTASSCDQVDVVTYLLSKGADPSIKDCDDLTPAQVAGDPSTRQLFHTLSDQ